MPWVLGELFLEYSSPCLLTTQVRASVLPPQRSLSWPTLEGPPPQSAPLTSLLFPLMWYPYPKMLYPSQCVISGGMRCPFAPFLVMLILIICLRWFLSGSFTVMLLVYKFFHGEILRDSLNILFLILLFPSNFSTYCWFLPETIITGVSAKWQFSIFFILHWLVGILWGRLFLSPSFIIFFLHSCLQVFISVWAHRFLFYSIAAFSMGYNPLWSLFILSVRLFQIWHGSPFKLPQVVSTDMGPHVPISIWTLPYLLAPEDVGGSSCNFLATALKVWLFPRKPWCLSLQNGMRHQDLGAGWGHWCWALGLSGPLRGRSGNVRTYAWIPTKSYLDTFCLYFKNCEFTMMSLLPAQHHSVCSS